MQNRERGGGFEPPFPNSRSGVLPLGDDPRTGHPGVVSTGVALLLLRRPPNIENEVGRESLNLGAAAPH